VLLGRPDPPPVDAEPREDVPPRPPDGDPSRRAADGGLDRSSRPALSSRFSVTACPPAERALEL
jgi:hypothetical protein